MTPSAYANARSAAIDGRIIAAIEAFDAGDRSVEATLNAIEELYAVGPTPDADAVASLAGRLGEPVPPAPVAHPEVEHDGTDGNHDAAQ